MKLIKLFLINCVVASALILPVEARKPVKPVFEVGSVNKPPEPLRSDLELVQRLERVPTDCRDFLSKYDWDTKIAYAIMMAESGGRSNARGDIKLTFNQNGVQYGDSWGCMQVRYLPGRPKPDELLDAGFNIDYAYKLYQKHGWSPWTQYRNGNYKKYLN